MLRSGAIYTFRRHERPCLGAHRAGMNTLDPGCTSAVDGLEPELPWPILSSLRMAKRRETPKPKLRKPG